MSNVASTVPITRITVPEYCNFCHLATVARSSVTRGEFQTVTTCRVNLLVLCSGQRGAVLLGVDERYKSELPTLHHKIFRALALHGVNEEEAHALLSAFPIGNASVKPEPALTCWLTYKLAIGEFMLEKG